MVEYAGGLEPVYAIAPDRQHEAAFYRNTVTHYFIDRAILEVALVQAAQEDPAADADVVAATWTARPGPARPAQVRVLLRDQG